MASHEEAQIPLVAERYNDPIGESKPPRKKQKRGNEPKNRRPAQPQQIGGLVSVESRLLEDGAEDMESGNASDSTSVTEPETLAQSMAPVQRLSTFDPSRSKVLSETETEWTVRLHPHDVSI